MCSEESLCSVPEAFSSRLFVSGRFPWVAVLAPPWLSHSYPSPSSFPLCVAKSGSHLAFRVWSLSHSPFQPLHFLPFRERCSSREAWPYSCTCVRHKQRTRQYLRRQVSVKVKSHGERKENLLRVCDPVCLLRSQNISQSLASKRAKYAASASSIHHLSFQKLIVSVGRWDTGTGTSCSCLFPFN